MENGELTRWFSFSIFAFYGCFFVRKGAPSRRTLRYNIYHQMKFAGAVCSCQANELRDTIVSRLRRVNRLCSRTVSDTANRLLKRTDSEGGPSATEEKILCRSPYFGAVTCRQSVPDSPRERGDSQEGGNRRCLPSCAPARRQRSSVRFSSDTPTLGKGVKIRG